MLSQINRLLSPGTAVLHTSFINSNYPLPILPTASFQPNAKQKLSLYASFLIYLLSRNLSALITTLFLRTKRIVLD